MTRKSYHKWPRHMPCANEEVWGELARAHALWSGLATELRAGAARSSEILHLSPIRCLILAHVGRASGLGVYTRRLMRLLDMPPSSLAHHLDVLQREGLITRAHVESLRNRKSITVRLTPRGGAELERVTELLSRRWALLEGGYRESRGLV